MNGQLAWLLVLLGLGVVVVRRRSVAVGLVSTQALVLAGIALNDATGGGDVGAAIALAVRGLAVGFLLLFAIVRTREPLLVRAGVAPLARMGLAVSFALALVWLVPTVGLDSRQTERAVLALVAFGAAAVALRRATLFQILGIVLVENGLALAALQLRGGSSLVIELGVAFDLALVALVATVFHERIFAEFGAGDSGALRSLRD